MKRKRAILYFLSLILVFFLVSCKSGDLKDEPIKTEDEGKKEEQSEGIEDKLDLIDTKTSLTTESFSEKKLTVLNIWASWCPPCINELPELEKLDEEYRD